MFLTQAEHQVTLYGVPELTPEDKEVRPDAWKDAAEVGGFGGEVAERSHAHDPVRVVTQDVILVRRKFARLHQMNRKVVPEVPAEEGIFFFRMRDTIVSWGAEVVM